MRAPVDPAVCPNRCLDRCAAPVAGATAAPIGIPAQVGFCVAGALGRLGPPCQGFVNTSRIGRDDHAGILSIGQENNGIRPQLLELTVAHLPSRRRRMDPVPKEQFGAIDVANPGNDALVHDKLSDRATRGSDGADEYRGVGILEQRIRAETGAYGLDLGCRQHLASRGTIEVSERLLPEKAKANRPSWGGYRKDGPVIDQPRCLAFSGCREQRVAPLSEGAPCGHREGPSAIEAEMNVEDMRCVRCRLERGEKMLAMGKRPGERRTVDQCSAVIESALRGRGLYDFAGEEFGKGCSETVDNMTFRHPGPFRAG